MEEYGSDKPDLRFGMKIRDLSDIVAGSSFSVFQSVLASGGSVKGIAVPGCGGYTRRELNDLNQLVRNLGGEGLVSISLGNAAGGLNELTMDMVRSIAAKYLTLEQVRQMAARCEADTGDLLLVVAGNADAAGRILGELRIEMARRIKLTRPDEVCFAFISDFPLFEKSKETGRWQAVHHPFTAPRDEDLPLLDTSPEQVKAKSYDIVCNGYELGGGSLRIYKLEMQQKIFRLLGYHDKETKALFGHMLEAFSYGAPPHGGIAVGIARLVMIMAGETTIREVIAFPKNQNAADLTFDAPSEVTEEQLKELHVCLRDD
jgi:aspartyl-tRNA synthetase